MGFIACKSHNSVILFSGYLCEIIKKEDKGGKRFSPEMEGVSPAQENLSKLRAESDDNNELRS